METSSWSLPQNTWGRTMRNWGRDQGACESCIGTAAGDRYKSKRRAPSLQGRPIRLGVFFSLSLLCIFTSLATAEDTPQLISEKPNRSAVGTCKQGGRAFRLFRLDVGPATRALRLQLSARGDLDLFILDGDLKVNPKLRGDELATFLQENAWLAGASETGKEMVTWSREDDTTLGTGTYLVCVAYLRDEPPQLRSGELVRTVPFELEARLFNLKTTSVLKPGESVEGVVDPLQGSFVTYEVLVPEGTDCLRLDLLSKGADLDLFVRKDKPALSTTDADAAATSLLPTEVLILDKDSTPPLKPGRYYIDVMEQGQLEWAVPFKLRCGEGAAPPEDLLAIPLLPQPRNPLERAIAATVEILCQESSGSGVMISEKGYFITNYHVVQEAQEAAVKQRIFVGFTADPTEPPNLHFEAEVVATDEDLDLALCRCVAGRYGQRLPDGYRFHALPPKAKVEARHGDPLWVLGFPATGGSGSRVSTTLTRGVICGFERRAAALHLKTDAQVNAGTSGGAALTKDFVLLGFPTETFSEEDGMGQLGYVRPVWLVPAEWWKTAGVRDTAVPPPTP